ncbi:hypothetical protein [Mesorhizobium sp. M0488]|uniref:hypothetical protein n=1 Tax=unclassified Mesorhizobium TaxID=325217 RepID=UPI0033354342
MAEAEKQALFQDPSRMRSLKDSTFFGMLYWEAGLQIAHSCRIDCTADCCGDHREHLKGAPSALYQKKLSYKIIFL